MYVLNFRIDKLPPILSNGSHMHWRNVHAIKKTWKQLTIWKCVGKIPDEPLTKAKVIFTRHSSVESDDDNLIMSFKAVRDGLVAVGVLEDDSPKVLEAEYLWKKTSPGKGFVSIEICEVAT